MIVRDIKITILTATYNSGKTLEQTISSVVNQDYDNIEFIIIDGMSTDNTVDIIKKYGKYGIRWISEPDSGLYDALNKGIDMATGDYFQVLGSDDALFSPDTISKVVSRIDADTDILSAAVMVVDEKSKRNYPLYNHHAIDRENYQGSMIPHPGMFVKTSIGKKYKFDTKYKIAADFKFFLQCYYIDKLKFKFTDDIVVFFANQGMSSDSEVNRIEDNMIYKELGLPFRNSPLVSRMKWKNNVKRILNMIHMLRPIIRIIESVKVYRKSKTHICNNKICRWCGRE